MRRAAFLPLTVLVALATAVALLGAAQALPQVVVDVPSLQAAATVATVHRFYAAVNAVIRSGDSALLRAAVAPDLIVGGGLGAVAVDAEGLARYLVALHQVRPDLEFVPDEVIADGGRVVVRLMFRSQQPGSFLGLRLTATPSVWNPVDVLRIADGRVVELWGVGADLVLGEELAGVSLDPAAGVSSGLGLARYTLAPDAPAVELAGGLVIGERGLIAAGIDGTGRLARSNSSCGPDRWEPAGPGSIVLRPGDRLVVPGAASVALASGDAGHAVALAMVASPEPTPTNDAALLPTLGTLDLAGTATDGVPISRTGVHVQPLAGGLGLILPSDAVTVAVGRVTLAPAATLSLAGGATTIVLAAEVGETAVSVDANVAEVRRRAVRRPLATQAATRGAVSRSEPGAVEYATPGRDTMLREGDGALLPPGTGFAIRNAGTEPAVVFILVAAPIAAG